MASNTNKIVRPGLAVIVASAKWLRSPHRFTLAIGSVAPSLALILFGHVADTHTFNAVALLLVAGGYLQSFGALGLDQVVMRIPSPSTAQRHGSVSWPTLLVVSVTVGAVLGGAIWWGVLPHYSGKRWIGAVLGAAYGAGLVASVLKSAVYRTLGFYSHAAVSLVGWRIVFTVTLVVLVRLGHDDATNGFYAVVLLAVSPLPFILTRIRPLCFYPGAYSPPQLLHGLMLAATSGSSLVALSIDRWIAVARFELGAASAYLLNAALASGAFGLLQTVISFSLMPRFAQSGHRLRPLFVTESKISVALGLAGTFGLILCYRILGPHIIDHSQYAPLLFTLLALAHSLRAPYAVASALIGGTGRAILLRITLGLGLLATLGAAIITFACAQLGPYGLALGVATAFVLRLCIWTMLARRALSERSGEVWRSEQSESDVSGV
ncbi:hypothetical protein HRbin33_01926 [bacterium HR33]|nr:hypothetical protein HRbin33_01926 [bacterium HR33]